MERHESILCRSLEIIPETCHGFEVESGIFEVESGIFEVESVGTSVGFTVPVLSVVIVESLLGDEEIVPGVSVVDSEEGPQAYSETPTIIAVNSFFIFVFFDPPYMF